MDRFSSESCILCGSSIQGTPVRWDIARRDLKTNDQLLEGYFCKQCGSNVCSACKDQLAKNTKAKHWHVKCPGCSIDFGPGGGLVSPKYISEKMESSLTGRGKFICYTRATMYGLGTIAAFGILAAVHILGELEFILGLIGTIATILFGVGFFYLTMRNLKMAIAYRVGISAQGVSLYKKKLSWEQIEMVDFTPSEKEIVESDKSEIIALIHRKDEGTEEIPSYVTEPSRLAGTLWLACKNRGVKTSFFAGP